MRLLFAFCIVSVFCEEIDELNADDSILIKKKELSSQIAGILTRLTTYVQGLPKYGEPLGNWLQDMKMNFSLAMLEKMKDSLIETYGEALVKIDKKGAPIYDFDVEYQKELLKRELQVIEGTLTKFWLDQTGNIFTEKEKAKIIRERQEDLDVLKKVHTYEEMEEIKIRYYEIHGAILKKLLPNGAQVKGGEWDKIEGPALQSIYKDAGVGVTNADKAILRRK